MTQQELIYELDKKYIEASDDLESYVAGTSF